MVPFFDSSVERGTAANGVNPPTMPIPLMQMGDCEVRRQFEYALLGGKAPYHSSATLKQQNASLVADASVYQAGTTGLAGNNMVPNAVGVGADFTFNMGSIQNFVNQHPVQEQMLPIHYYSRHSYGICPPLIYRHS